MQIKKTQIKLPPAKKTNMFKKMIAGAMPAPPSGSSNPMPTTLRLHGKHAKHFHGMKPGAKVSAHIRGTVQNTGLDQYAGNQPTAEIQVSHIMPRKIGIPGGIPGAGGGQMMP